jgi:DNA (cytosine-5)-methyltransferase 1
LPSRFGIIDLFAGPGGLGEGFASYKDDTGDHPYSIEISIEKEVAAHRTLLLRSFLRKFSNHFPDDYYDFLNGQSDEPDWSTLYPEKWADAEQEAQCLTLGTEKAGEVLRKKTLSIRKKFGERTILIGGPPCQAYSLAGRSRNASIDNYEPHKDDRHFLYKEYVNVLRGLKPAAFVMENVKGILSSAIMGDRIFNRVLEDLRGPDGKNGYRLFALSPRCFDLSSDVEPAPRDFVVCTEDHGVPQARHRVIIVGIRRAILDQIVTSDLPHLLRLKSSVFVKDVLGAMPHLRSGLSRNDDQAAWFVEVSRAVETLQRNIGSLADNVRDDFAKVLEETRSALMNRGMLDRVSKKGAGIPNSCPEWLRDWLIDSRLVCLPNNETRGHMSSDLSRYMFAAAFGRATGRSPKSNEFPSELAPDHKNWDTGKFADRFRVQVESEPATTVTSHISKDGNYFIHPDPSQCRSLTVREAARLQTFPDNYFFKGNRTQQYTQVGNAVPPYLAYQIAECIWSVLGKGEFDREIGNEFTRSAVGRPKPVASESA